MRDDVSPQSVSSASITRSPSSRPGRLSVLSFLGAATGAVPLPFLPSRMVTRVRGAIVYDVTRRHGLSVTNDARHTLAAANSPDPRRARIVGLANWLAGRLLRRLGPMWVLSPAVSAIETYALGHLLDRYLEEVRTGGPIRIQSEEAQRIRVLIDRTLLKCLMPNVVVATDPSPDNPPGEDERDDVTRLVDWTLLSSAAAPSYLLRRLDAAFDEIIRDRAAESAE